MAKHLAQPFSLLASRVGKPLEEEMLTLYCECFVERGLAPNFVIQAMRSLAIRWDNGWWPSAEQIAIAAASEQREAFRNPGVHTEYRQIERNWELDMAERDDLRKRKATPWVKEHPEEVDKIKEEVRHEIQRLIKKYPEGEMARRTDYRKAFFDGAVVTGILEAQRIETLKIKQKKIAPKKKSEGDPVRVGEVIAA